MNSSAWPIAEARLPRRTLTTRMLVWTCAVYLMVWVLPEPVFKVVAAALTVGFIVWLGVSTV